MPIRPGISLVSQDSETPAATRHAHTHTHSNMLMHGSSSSASTPAVRKNVASVRYNNQSLRESSSFLGHHFHDKGKYDAMDEDENYGDFQSFRSDTPTSTYTSSSSSSSASSTDSPSLLASSRGNGVPSDLFSGTASVDHASSDDDNDSIWNSLFSNGDGDDMMIESPENSSCDEESGSRPRSSRQKQAVSQFAAVPSSKNRCTSFTFPR